MSGSGDHAEMNRNVYWVFGRRVIWSPWWWLTAVGVAFAAILIFALPVSDGGDLGSTGCGTLIAPDESYVDAEGVEQSIGDSTADECESLRGARWQRIVSILAASLLPLWLGTRDNRRGDVNAAHAAAAACLVTSILLLVGPQTTSGGYDCGSPVLRGQATLTELEGEDGADACAKARPGRLAWAMLFGVAAVPFAMGASRGRPD